MRSPRRPRVEAYRPLHLGAAVLARGGDGTRAGYEHLAALDVVAAAPAEGEQPEAVGAEPEALVRVEDERAPATGPQRGGAQAAPVQRAAQPGAGRERHPGAQAPAARPPLGERHGEQPRRAARPHEARDVEVTMAPAVAHPDVEVVDPAAHHRSAQRRDTLAARPSQRARELPAVEPRADRPGPRPVPEPGIGTVAPVATAPRAGATTLAIPRLSRPESSAETSPACAGTGRNSRADSAAADTTTATVRRIQTTFR